MHFLMSNGAPATFAVDRATALDEFDGLRCFAVAC